MAQEPQESFNDLRTRLDEIAAEVRSKEVSLEKSLDLFEEAVKLGNRCAELVDKPDFTREEQNTAELDELVEEAEAKTEEDIADASEEEAE